MENPISKEYQNSESSQLTPNNTNLAPGFIDDLEGIVNNEPTKNKYEIIKFHKMNIFPYFLIGKVVSKFEIDGVNKYLNGVGILVGPNIVLTVAHNLCHMITLPNGSKKILKTKKVLFYAAANGDFNLFEPVKNEKIHIPKSYIDSLNQDNKEEQLYSDWGMVTLSIPIGDQIIKILDVEKTNNMKLVDNLYQFFINNQNLNLSKLAKQTKTEKISIVGYTEYKDNYKNNKAYKFSNNFVTNKSSFTEIKNNNEKSPISSTKFPHNNFNQGKLISELVNDKDLFTISNDKKININININTSENVNEGLLSTPLQRHYNYINQNQNKKENEIVDYIILGNEEYNKEINFEDVDKLIMCESKGNLIGLAENEDENQIFSQNEDKEKSYENLLKAIKYQISTYKGQSGSPIFLRIKRITDKNNPNKHNSKSNYFYHFIGLHSRRGPLAGDLMFYESEKMNNLTENLITDGDAKNNFKMNLPFLDKEENYSINLNNEIIKQNGICEYNIALSIIGETIKEIKEIIEKQKEEDKRNLTTNLINDEVYGNYYNDNYSRNVEDNFSNLKSEFILTKIFLNGNLQISGLFKKNVNLATIFSFGSKIFNVPNEYILLKDLNNCEFSHIYNYNFDHNKKYSDIIQDSDVTDSMSFELLLNIKKFGEFLSHNILQKFLENYDLEESQLKNDFTNKYMKPLFHSIFAEIHSFDSTQPFYGKLFKKIRKTILNKLEL